MKDVQSQIDERDVSLDQVGIKDFVFPMQIRNKHGEWNSTAANIGLFVGLPATQKGTHMSRFVDIIQKNRKMDLKHMRRILEQIRDRLEAETSYMVLKFDYFIEKYSPVTNIPSLVNVKVEYRASLVGDECTFDMKVITPVTTLLFRLDSLAIASSRPSSRTWT